MSTKEEVKKLVMDMANELPKFIEEKTDKLLASGAIDLDNELGGPAILPKIIICAIAEEIKFQFAVPHRYSHYSKFNKEVKNLAHFI